MSVWLATTEKPTDFAKYAHQIVPTASSTQYIRVRNALNALATCLN